MKAKFNRGPMSGKVVDWNGSDHRYLVQYPIKPYYRLDLFDPETEIKFRQGEYHKSFRRLKDGTIIFEWMGWTDGKV